MLKKKLIENEYPDKETNAEKKKYFVPKLLTASDWCKDVLTETLDKIKEMRDSSQDWKGCSCDTVRLIFYVVPLFFFIIFGGIR